MAVDERTRRLLELKDAVKAFFEVTGGAGTAWDTAFRAVRRNDEMAQSFVADLRRLVEHIETTYAPARAAAPARERPAPPATPRPTARATSSPPELPKVVISHELASPPPA